ncbi:hypothetical protein KAFR_0C02240 [Kazachstania africana CBS 2517]|uniref:Monopolar spindle protein 2 n=1 Tax=Kazachstania africana (strain ATCC 22294 / BCRC 22015 / CBS 2517 / CECT 1963 / NBRC 1671 / NRRL Y-8276) TaxID=1071382 RepID=H2AS67_KAZAF|nr:hypothetical protein KAFR_0C02240 [Kazachstania africana CBS 2517]CCF57217.1 hypothetical protein KAFR_0C02240 [Kazachstania africana CBS 2517]
MSKVDKYWDQIDVKSRDHIYGNELPKLINSVKGKDILLNDTKLNVIKQFANDKPFHKIYKLVLDQFLDDLIGVTFTQLVATDKNDDMKEKEQEILRLNEKINYYKEKFEIIEKEFKFYKETVEKRSRDGSSSDVDNEFIIIECRKQLAEQSKLIANLQKYVNNNNNHATRNSGIKQTKESILNPNIKSFIILCGITLILVVILLYYVFTAITWSNIDGTSFISRIVWNVHDFSTSNNYKMSEQDIEAYNKIFGI